jgi:pimeloyl-ACP methyl ester carboxylesterase
VQFQNNVKLGRHRYADTEAELGSLRVPVRHAMPGYPAMQLQFVRLPARAADPEPAVIFLTGGPGLSGIRAGEGRLFPMFDSLRDHRDVILLDQRACVPAEKLRGRTAPRAPTWFPFYGLVSRDEYLAAIRDTVAREASYLELHGIPTDALNTNESADDVAMLARSLYRDDVRVVLVGWSYGSHLAMAVMKRHRQLVERVVLAAPEGPDHTLKRPLFIQQHLARLAERALPFDLMGSLTRVLESLARTPGKITLAGNNSENHNGSGNALIGRFDMEWVISEVLSDPRVLRRLPVFVQHVEAGDFSMVGSDPRLRRAWESLRDELPHSVARYCMDCASGATASRRAMIMEEAQTTLLGRTIDFPLPEVSDAVGNPDLGDEFRAPPRADIPVLFITGTLDCRTPAENVGDLAPGLPSHQHLVVEDAGHGDLLLASSVQRAITEFVGKQNLESTVVSADVPFRFDAA